MDNENKINRSALLVMAFEVEGLCTGLRQTVPNGLAPSATTLSIMNKLLATFSEKSNGGVLDNLPALTEHTSPVDCLIVAEILRSTLMAFLTPDELDERDRTFGFASPRKDSDQ
jgi:hypothetical protein